MSETIRPADLLIDEQNPRILQPNAGQKNAIQALGRLQGKKLLALTEDIISHGVNPSDLLIVTPQKGDPKRYIVLEGNRRLAALRALENPELLADVVQPAMLKRLRQLNHAYQDNPVESVECLVMASRAEADHWIELRHTGERGGAGIVPWGSDESARFRARTGELEIHQQALDFLERRGDLSPEARQAVPSTSFKRLLDNPTVKSKIGIEKQDGKLYLLADENKVAKAMLHIADDLSSGRIKVGDIYTAAQRVGYANALSPSVVVKPTKKSGQGVDIATGQAQAKPKRPPTAKVPKLRDKLIPGDCILGVSDGRCAEIERELRRLSLTEYPNAVSVLFRVFVELGVDAYIATANLSMPKDPSLANKMQMVTNDLVTRRKLTPAQAKAPRRAFQKDTLLAASVTLMHNYVHNQFVFPGPGDLRTGWNNLQPFMTAIWAP